MVQKTHRVENTAYNMVIYTYFRDQLLRAAEATGNDLKKGRDQEKIFSVTKNGEKNWEKSGVLQPTSLWPAMNFVAECRTRSAPRGRAFWLMGEAKVPSMQTRAPFSWQSFETSSMSTHRNSGLVGDSVKNKDTYRK